MFPPFFAVFSKESLWVKAELLISLLVDFYPLDNSLCVGIHITMVYLYTVENVSQLHY